MISGFACAGEAVADRGQEARRRLHRKSVGCFILSAAEDTGLGKKKLSTRPDAGDDVVAPPITDSAQPHVSSVASASWRGRVGELNWRKIPRSACRGQAAYQPTRLRDQAAPRTNPWGIGHFDKINPRQPRRGRRLLEIIPA